MPSRWEVAQQAFNYGAAPSAAVAYRVLGNANTWIQNGRDFFGALEYVRREVERERAIGNPQRDVEISLALDPEYNRPSKKMRTTDNRFPNGNELSGGQITIAQGAGAHLTKSRHNVKFRRGRKISLYKQLMHSNVWRWQSIYNFDVANTQLNRSLPLNIVTWTGNADEYGYWMPMYAFDLSTMPGQGRLEGTKTQHNLQSVPLYRLFKKCPNYKHLDPGVQNYVWRPVPGYQNGPSGDYKGTASYYWGAERLNMKPQRVDSVKHDWTSVDILFGCPHDEQCKVHTSVVTFMNGAGPKRMYTEGDTAELTTNTTVLGVKSLDQDVTLDQASGIDVTYESFWDKASHPLSQYNVPDKSKYINFIRDYVVNMNQMQWRDSTQSDRYHHMKNLFISGGGFVNLKDNKDADNQIGGMDTDFASELPPVYRDQTGWVNGFGYNTIKSYNTSHELYDGAPDHRKNNMWLLIWMEHPMPSAGNPAYPQEASTTGSPAVPKQWPSFAGADDGSHHDCTFDIKVRSKFTYVLPVGHLTS